jgi:hypothetical protein
MWFEVHTSLLLKVQDLLKCDSVFADVMTDCATFKILGDFLTQWHSIMSDKTHILIAACLHIVLYLYQ